MSFSVAQAVKASGGSVSGITTAGITTQSSGSQFVVFIAREANVAVSSVTDNKGNTYAVKADLYNGGNSGGVDGWTGSTGGCWVATNATPSGGTGHTFTVTLASTDFPTIIAFECSGLDVTVDAGGSASVNHSANTTPASFTSPTITTATAADVVFGFGGNTGDANSPSQTITAGVGGGTYTTPTNGSSTTVTGLPAMVGYQVVSATSTYSATYTPHVSETNSWAGIVAFKQSPTGTTPSSTDSATLTDTVNKIGVGGAADSGALSESSKIGLGTSDTASLAEQQAIALLNTDTAAFVEQVAVAVTTATSDTAQVGEQASIGASTSTQDTGQVGDQATVSAAASAQDTAALAEQIKIALTAVDSAQLGEAMAIALASNDTAHLQELVSVALAIADAASLSTETLSVQQNGGNTPSASDSATLTDAQLAVAARVSASDVGTLAEQAAIALKATDVAAMTEQIGLGLIAADSAALTEQLRVAITTAATDSAALADVQVAVNAALAASDAATLGESVTVQVFSGGLRDWVYAISEPTLAWSASEPSARWTTAELSLRWSVSAPIQ